jgi:phosphatidylglycerophosphate synthase
MAAPRSRRDVYLSIPNFLTYVRILLIPLVMILIGLQEPPAPRLQQPALPIRRDFRSSDYRSLRRIFRAG